MATNKTLGEGSALVIEIGGDPAGFMEAISLSEKHMKRLQEEASKPTTSEAFRKNLTEAVRDTKVLHRELEKVRAARAKLAIAAPAKGTSDYAAKMAAWKIELAQVGDQRQRILALLKSQTEAMKAHLTYTERGTRENAGTARILEDQLKYSQRRLAVERLINEQARKAASQLASGGGEGRFRVAVAKGRLADQRDRQRMTSGISTAGMTTLKAKMADLTLEANRMGGTVAAAAAKANQSFSAMDPTKIRAARAEVSGLKDAVDRASRTERFDAAYTNMTNKLHAMGMSAVSSGRMSQDAFNKMMASFQGTSQSTARIDVLKAKMRELSGSIQQTAAAVKTKTPVVAKARVAVARYTKKANAATAATKRMGMAARATGGQMGGMTRALGGMRSFIQPGIGGLSSLSMGLYGIHPAAGAAMMGIATLKSSIEQLFEAGKEGAQFVDMRASFERMSGIDPLPLVELRDALKGTVDDQTLMQFANLGRQIGVAGKDIPQLAKVAKAAAQNLGESTEFMYESIMKGTARRERRILDNLGIGIENLSALYRTNALAMGKSVADLTKEEKDYIFIQEVMKRSELIVASATDAKADSYYRLETRIRNTKNTLKELWALGLSGDSKQGLGAFLGDFDEWSSARAVAEIDAVTAQMAQGKLGADGFARSMKGLQMQEADQRTVSSWINFGMSLSAPLNTLRNASEAWDHLKKGELFSAAWNVAKLSVPALDSAIITGGALIGWAFGGEDPSAYQDSMVSAIESYLDPEKVWARANTTLENLKVQMGERFAALSLPTLTLVSEMPMPFSDEMLAAIYRNFDDTEKMYIERWERIRAVAGGGLGQAGRGLMVRSVAEGMKERDPTALEAAMVEGVRALGIESITPKINALMDDLLFESFGALSGSSVGGMPLLDFHSFNEAMQAGRADVDRLFDEHIGQLSEVLERRQMALELIISRSSKLRHHRWLGDMDSSAWKEWEKSQAASVTDVESLLNLVMEQAANVKQVLMEQQNIALMFSTDRDALRKKAAESNKKDDLVELFLKDYKSQAELQKAMYDQFKDYKSIMAAYNNEIATYTMPSGSMDRVNDALSGLVGRTTISTGLLKKMKEGKLEAIAELTVAVYSSKVFKDLLADMSDINSATGKDSAKKMEALILGLKASVVEIQQLNKILGEKGTIGNVTKGKGGKDSFLAFANLLDAAAEMTTKARKHLIEEQYPLIDDMNRVTSAYDSALQDMYKKKGEIGRHQHAALADLAEMDKTINDMSVAKSQAMARMFSEKRRELTDSYMEEVLGVTAFSRANQKLSDEAKKYRETLKALAAQAQDAGVDFAISGEDLLADGAPQKLIDALRKGMEGLNKEQQQTLQNIIDQTEVIASMHANIVKMEESSARHARSKAIAAAQDTAMGQGDPLIFDASALEKAINGKEAVARLRATMPMLDKLKFGYRTVGQAMEAFYTRMESGAVVVRVGGEAIDEQKMKLAELSAEYNSLAEKFNLDTVTKASELGVESMLFGINSMLDLTEWKMEEWASSVGSFANTMINDVGKILGTSASMAAGGNMLVGGLVQGAFTAVGSFVSKLFNWNKSKDANVHKAVERLAEKKRDINVYMTLEHHGLNVNAETARNVSRAMRKAIESGERI